MHSSSRGDARPPTATVLRELCPPVALVPVLAVGTTQDVDEDMPGPDVPGLNACPLSTSLGLRFSVLPSPSRCLLGAWFRALLCPMPSSSSLGWASGFVPPVLTAWGLHRVVCRAAVQVCGVKLSPLSPGHSLDAVRKQAFLTLQRNPSGPGTAFARNFFPLPPPRPHSLVEFVSNRDIWPRSLKFLLSVS